MSDREKCERQREVVTANCAAPADSKSLCDVCCENLRTDDHREDRGNNRSPQHREQTGAAVFDIRSVRGIAAAANLEHFSAGDAFRIRQVRSRH